ncbi:hypothetical protein HOY82DRAFT_493588 [Tuber indicum]|nr:hypothetical protein HOY82DRAFT_493588 [Tuber indicum]
MTIQRGAELREREIMREHQDRFKGSARLSIMSLQFPEGRSRAIDQRNIDRLVDIYRAQGCLRRDSEHRIPALINSNVLTAALEASGVLPQMLVASGDDPPVLQFPDHSIECLHGRHRVLAATKYFEPDSRWWVVDLYDKGITELQQYFQDGYANSKRISDGEIFRRIRLYNQSGQRDLERNMWCYLSVSKRRDLRQLLATKPLRKAFDNLLQWPGLWPPIRLGTLHRLLTMRCDEACAEVVRYLRHIRNIWTRICIDRADLMASTDCRTVEMLQLRAPCSSNTDRSYIELELESRLLYPTITDIRDRQLIRESIGQMRRIPSLYTFFEDLKYLECCSKALRSLIGSQRGTIYECMSQLYSRDGLAYLPVELPDGTFRECATGSTDGRELGYQQLWLYAMRHFPEMVVATPRKEQGRAKPEVKEPDSRTWYGFARLAQHLGFASEQIDALVETDPDEKAARDFILSTRPLEQYSIEPHKLQNSIRQIKGILKDMLTRSQRLAKDPELVTVGCPGEALSRRCGRPYQQSYEYDRHYLYIDLLYCDEPEGEDIPSLYSRREVFFAFFGRRTLQHAGTKRGHVHIPGSPVDSRPAPAQRQIPDMGKMGCSQPVPTRVAPTTERSEEDREVVDEWLVEQPEPSPVHNIYRWAGSPVPQSRLADILNLGYLV